jgi:hypothetical protein
LEIKPIAGLSNSNSLLLTEIKGQHGACSGAKPTTPGRSEQIGSFMSAKCIHGARSSAKQTTPGLGEKNEDLLTLHRLFCISKEDVTLCRWTQVGGGRLRSEIGGYIIFVDEKKYDYRSLFIV